MKPEPRRRHARLVVAQGGDRHPMPPRPELPAEGEVRVEVAQRPESVEENRGDGRSQSGGFMFGIFMPGAIISVSV